ncbi:MAG TPA: DUF4160 domain-containing protein [Candidatus Didemnitutus sp.]|nr:DUF4160 domain-containing protein [Candidatus Didemnitutus sp.]
MISIESARAAGGFTVAIRDEAGVYALADLSAYMNGRLAPCADPAVFSTLRAALGTIVWNGGFDIDPDNVFAAIIPNTEEQARVTFDLIEDTMMLHPSEHHMPIVSVFFGLIISMFYDERQHNTPHIHVRYAEHNATVNIHTGDVMAGSLPRPKLRLVEAWIELHRDELLANWELMKAGLAPERVKPLE